MEGVGLQKQEQGLKPLWGRTEARPEHLEGQAEGPRGLGTQTVTDSLCQVGAWVVGVGKSEDRETAGPVAAVTAQAQAR